MNIENKNIGKQLTRPTHVAEICRAILRSECMVDQDKEHLWVFGLNGQNKIKYIELVSLGTLNNTNAHPREIFRFAIMQAVASILVAHNHPSDETEPSDRDAELTKVLIAAGNLLRIPILDHVIVCPSGYFSFQAHGLIS